jgi:hypothetical protein
VTYQLSPALRERLSDLLAEASLARPIYRLGCEGYGAEHPQLTMTIYRAAAVEERQLAVVSGHASWVEWHAPPTPSG